MLKYKQDGNLEYSKAWIGNNIFDSPQAMALTGTNIYICGRTDTLLGGADTFLLKYDIDTAGIEWAKTWGGINNDTAYAVAIDSANNIYIAGETNSWEPNGDIFLVKYDTAGNIVWQKTWGGSNRDAAYGIAIDSADNIYLCGQTLSWTARGDALLLKFDSSGNVLWRRTWGNTNQQRANAITIDNTGDIYLAGETFTGAGTDSDAFILKYDSAGTLIQQKSWHLKSNDMAFGITSDIAGNIYICGKTAGSQIIPSSETGFLLAVANNGVLTKQITLNGNIGSRELKAMTNDTFNIYLAGMDTNNSVLFQNVAGVVTELSFADNGGTEDGAIVTGPFMDAPTGIIDITGIQDTGAGKSDVLFLRQNKIE